MKHAVLILLAVTSLAAQEGQQPARRTTRGTIVKATPTKPDLKVLGSVEVKGDRRNMIFWITRDTKLQRIVGKRTEECKFGDLETGDHVEIVYGSDIVASDPPQAGAHHVIVRTGAK